VITGAQIRAARGLVRWSALDLAKRAKLGVSTVRRAELANGPHSITIANAAAIQQALEKAGVEFIPEGEEKAGVRLRKSPPLRTDQHSPPPSPISSR
jgi:transcriptional regulator with XRE-family HTH domain